MDDALLFFLESDGTLLAAIAPELLHIFIGVAVTLGIPERFAISDGPWVVVALDLIHDLHPWDQAVEDTHLES